MNSDYIGHEELPTPLTHLISCDSPKKPYKTKICIGPILQIMKLGLREVNSPAQGHT